MRSIGPGFLALFALAAQSCGTASTASTAPSRAPVSAESEPEFPLVAPEVPPEHAASEASGNAGPELVLQGGHVGWIHDTALSPDGRLAALLSLDMPDMGQEMTPALPFATLTLVDTSTYQIRASWRFLTPDLSGLGQVHFSRAGDQVMTEGGSFRSWDLHSGELTTLSSQGHAWMRPSPDGQTVADLFFRPRADHRVPDERELEIRRVEDGRALWSTSVTLAEGSHWRGAGAVTWHPFSDGRVVVAGRDGLRLFNEEGEVMARDTIISPSVLFRPLGGALYVRSESDSLALEPRGLRTLSRAPWHSVYAISADGRRIVGSAPSSLPRPSPTIFDARTGERLADVPFPADVDWSETEHSPRTFSFTPDGSALWTAWYVGAPASLAPEGVHVPDPAQDTNAEEQDEPWIDFIALQSWNTIDGTPGRTFYRSLDQPIPNGRGPLSLQEEGPELVAHDAHLVVALMRRMVIFSHAGEVQHEDVDGGIETLLTGAAEAPDGRGLALVSPAALGWFGSGGASSLLCPGILDSSPTVRANNEGARLFAQRYACSSRESAPRAYEAILGVSADGNAMVVAEGDIYSGGGETWVVSGRRRRRLRGIRTWCQSDGCGPEATFVPGGRHVVIEGKLFDARTGRLVREGGRGTFSADGSLVAYRGTAVEELVSGRTIYETQHELPPDGDGHPFIRPQFSPDAHHLAFVAFRGDRSWLVVADLRQARKLWELPLEGSLRQLWFNERGHVAITTGDEGERRLHVLNALTGEPIREAMRVPSSIRASATGSRLAWCGGGRLYVVNTGEPTHQMGPCLGQVLHVGEHFVVSADGSLAQVTRLANGRSLRLRLAVYPSRMAWTVAEDDTGAWSMPPRAFSAYLVRSGGTIVDAALSALSEESPGYAPNLVQDFFASVN